LVVEDCDCSSPLFRLRFTLLFGLAVNFRNRIRQLRLKELLRWLDEDDGRLWKDSEALRNVALIQSVRTLTDSKLDLCSGTALLEHYRGSLLQSIRHKAEERLMYMMKMLWL
ncbi:hypothetical protein BHE74_00056180, partial [Ensete ventricosum]